MSGARAGCGSFWRWLGRSFHWSDLNEPRDFTESFFIHRYILGIGRILVSCYILGVLITAWLTEWDSGRIYRYFTYVSYTLLWLYFSFAATNSAVRFFYKLDPARKRPNAVEYVLWVLQEIVFTFAIFLDPGAPTFVSINAHAINALFVLLELFLGRITWAWPHFIFPLAFGLAYVFFAWIWHAESGEWIYSFLSWSQSPGAAVGYYLGLFIAAIAIFFLLWGATLLRNWLAKKCRCGSRSDEEEDVVEMSTRGPAP